MSVLVLGLVWTAIAAYRLDSARRHAQVGLDRLRDAQRQLDPAELIRGGGLGDMQAAQAEFDDAAAAADSFFVSPFQVLPVVGRQVRSVRALTRGASQVVDVGVAAMDASSKQLDTTTQSGAERVSLVERLDQIGATASAGLRDVGAGPGNALIGPLADAREKFVEQLHKAQRAMRDLHWASSGIGEMASGPSKYLVLAANSAEMRSGSGMLLSAGVLTVSGGQFSLGEMVSVTDLPLPPGAVALDGDYGARWGWLQPTEEWRYLAMSPQFDVTGRLASEMWQAKTGESVDGVLALDPIALKALVKVSGPVQVDGKQIDEGNLVNEIMLQQYLDYPVDENDPDSELPYNDQRRERNGVIARAIVDQLDKSGWNIADLVDDLRSAGRGRHVMFWSSKPNQQRGWKAAGVSGVLPRDGFMVSLSNRSGNKLDQFVAVSADLSHRPVARGTEVTGTITIRNEAPAQGLNRYVEGPYPGSDFSAGEYKAILAVNVPRDASGIALDGVNGLVASGPDGTTRVVAGEVRMLRGATVEVTVRFTVPRGREHLEVIPSARYPAIEYAADSQRWDDDGPRALEW